jgi:copper chaperone CopZ
MEQTHTFHVSGMHCHSCILLTEGELSEYPGVTKAVSSLKTHSVTVTGDFGEQTPEAIAVELNAVLKKHGYTLSVEKQEQVADWSQFRIALPVALVLVALFLGLQKTGIVNLVDTTTVSYGTVRGRQGSFSYGCGVDGLIATQERGRGRLVDGP